MTRTSAYDRAAGETRIQGRGIWRRRSHSFAVRGRSCACCGWCRVSTEWVRLFDINGDYFELVGLGYPDADVVPVLNSFNTPFDPESIHQPTDEPYKEFKTGRRYPWAADRVM